MNLNQLTIHESHELLKKRRISSVDLTKAVLGRIDQVEDNLHALVTITAEKALAQAEKADERIKNGDMTPLTGIPAIIKDNICTRGIRTTCSSNLVQ